MLPSAITCSSKHY